MGRKQHHGYIAKARKKHSRCPEYRGKLEIDGRFFWLSGWIKVNEFGRKFLSLAATERPVTEKSPQDD